MKFFHGETQPARPRSVKKKQSSKPLKFGAPIGTQAEFTAQAHWQSIDGTQDEKTGAKTTAERRQKAAQALQSQIDDIEYWLSIGMKKRRGKDLKAELKRLATRLYYTLYSDTEQEDLTENYTEGKETVEIVSINGIKSQF